MKTVLSIDGGGIKGIIAALALEEIERQIGKPISDCFDLICGVSTGGIIASILTIPDDDGRPKYKASDVVKFYREEGRRIFRKRSKIPFYYLFKSKYRHSRLKDAIRSRIGDLPFNHLTNRVMIPCYDLIERRPYFFKNWYPDIINVATYQVATATSSAPTYFDPQICNMGNGSTRKLLVDGSVAVNNPTACAYAEAKRLWGNEEIFVVSIGTGDVTDPIENQKRWGFLNWYPEVIEVLVDAPTNTVDYQLRNMIPRHYVRFQNKINYSSEKLDDVSFRNIRRLLTEGKSFVESDYHKYTFTITALKKRLKEKTDEKV